MCVCLHIAQRVHLNTTRRVANCSLVSPLVPLHSDKDLCCCCCCRRLAVGCGHIGKCAKSFCAKQICEIISCDANPRSPCPFDSNLLQLQRVRQRYQPSEDFSLGSNKQKRRSFEQKETCVQLAHVPELKQSPWYRAGHFRYLLIFSIIKNDFLHFLTS